MNRYESNFLSEISKRKVLEIGCGEGFYTAILRKKNKVVPTDVRRRNIKGFVKASAYSLPFRNRSFDAVFAGSVLHHLPDLERAVKEIKRVLKPGGYFYGIEPSGNWFYVWKYLLLPLMNISLYDNEHAVYKDKIMHAFETDGFSAAISPRFGFNIPILRETNILRTNLYIRARLK
jgi:ubiquinone/menaquinone biosynthesis C-methylase UbiE